LFLSRNGYSIIACDGGRHLGEKIDRLLKEKDPFYRGMVGYEEKVWPNGEVTPKLLTSVRGHDIYIVQCVEAPTLERDINSHLMALYNTIDAAIRADSDKITVIVPEYPYARQERRSGKEKGRREPIAAKVVAKILESMGAHRVITIDVHADAIEGFFDIPFDNIYLTNFIIPALRKRYSSYLENARVSSFDLGGVKRTNIYAARMKLNPVFLYKEKNESGTIDKERMVLYGDVRDKFVIGVDDIIATAGSLESGIETLIEEGARGVIVACSLPLFNGPAIDRLDRLYNDGNGPLIGLIGTNAVWHGENFYEQHPWYSDIDLAPIFAQIIKTIQGGRSLNELLDRSTREDLGKLSSPFFKT